MIKAYGSSGRLKWDVRIVNETKGAINVNQATVVSFTSDSYRHQ